MHDLTTPQRVLLYMIKIVPQRCSPNYKPALALIKYGLAEWDERGHLQVTQAGLDWRDY